MRKKHSLYPYHVSARCINKMHYPLNLDEVWEVYEKYIYFLIHGFSFRINSFVLMPNHFHMILQTPKANISEGMNYFMRETSREINRLAGRLNHLYGRRYHASLVSDLRYYYCVYKYVYYNPVKAGLSNKVEEYPFSSLQIKLGKKQPSLICCDDITFGEPNLEDYLDWLNRSLKKQQISDIQKGFKKKEFKFSKDSKTLKELKELYKNHCPEFGSGQ